MGLLTGTGDKQTVRADAPNVRNALINGLSTVRDASDGQCTETPCTEPFLIARKSACFIRTFVMYGNQLFVGPTAEMVVATSANGGSGPIHCTESSNPHLQASVF